MKISKIISILLLICMLISLCSLSAFAADGDTTVIYFGASESGSEPASVIFSTGSSGSAKTAADDVTDMINGLKWLPDMQVDPGNTFQRSQVLSVWSAYLQLSAAERQDVPQYLLDWLYYLVGNTDYAMIGGKGGWWYQGKKEGLSFSAIDPKQKFAAVYVDGEYVSSYDYTYYWYGVNDFGHEDIVVVTLKPSYLATLGIGEHSITISYPNGYAPGYFYIVDSTATPHTGDTANIPLWSGLLFLSMTSGAACLMLCRKKEE